MNSEKYLEFGKSSRKSGVLGKTCLKMSVLLIWTLKKSVWFGSNFLKIFTIAWYQDIP